MAKLLKFEEVDFGHFGFLQDWASVNATLRRLTASISSGEDSKLKILSLPVRPRISEGRVSETLAEARKVLTVNTFHPLPARPLLFLAQIGIQIE